MVRRSATATVGLASTLTVLAAVCTWAAIDATRTTNRANHELTIASAYEGVLEAVAAEHDAQLS